MSIEFVNWPDTYHIGIDGCFYPSKRLHGVKILFLDFILSPGHLQMVYDTWSENALLEEVDCVYDDKFYNYTSAEKWNDLVKFIQKKDLQRIFQTEGPIFLVDTSTYANTDLKPNELQLFQPSEKETVLQFTNFDVKKSWSPTSFMYRRLVQSAWHGELDSALAEYSFAYLAYAFVSHYAALSHWKKLLEVLLQSYTLAELEPDYYSTFLGLFCVQIETLHERDIETSTLSEKNFMQSLLENLLERKSDGNFPIQVNNALNQLVNTVSDVLHIQEFREDTILDDHNAAIDYDQEVHEIGQFVVDDFDNDSN